MPRPDAADKLKANQPPEGPSKVLIAAVIAVALVIVGGIAWLRTDPFGSLDATPPKGGNPAGAGVVAYPGAARPGVPTVDLYEDFQCPVCGQLEERNGRSIFEMAKAGDIKLVVHLMSFLDGNLDNDSSKRAANAAFCASDAGRFPEFHAAVFAALPAHAHVVNVGRGRSLVEADLVRAIEQGQVAAASLDVFETEPLPPDSPLWTLPGVHVSAHMSGDVVGWRDRLADQFVDLAERWLADEPLPYAVDKQGGFVATGAR